MPTPTYIALGNLTLGATDTSILIDKIPNTYRDLVVVFNGTFTGTDTRIRVNALTTSIYSWVTAQGTGSGSGTSETLGPSNLGVGFGGTTAGNRIMAQMHFMDYSATNKNKTVLIRVSEPSQEVRMSAARIDTLNAINKIEFRIQNGGGSYSVGSTFTIYGIVS